MQPPNADVAESESYVANKKLLVITQRMKDARML